MLYIRSSSKEDHLLVVVTALSMMAVVTLFPGQIFLRIPGKGRFTAEGTEVVRLAFIFIGGSSRFFIYMHSANGIDSHFEVSPFFLLVVQFYVLLFCIFV
jgi:hypothetical protein